MRGADLFVLAAYFLTMLAVGFAYSRQQTCDTYFAADRQVSWWLGGVSFFLSNVSAFSIIVYAGIAFQFGLVALTIYWVAVPATIFATVLFARRWHRSGVITPTEFLENRFSPAVRQVLAWSGIPLRVADEALKIVAIGVFVSGGMRISPLISMIVVGITILVYSVLGGLWAVVVTVFVQFVLVTGALVLLLPLSYKAAGGWAHLTSHLPQAFLSPVNGPYTWVFVVGFLILNLISQSGNWPLIQKFYSARSDRDAILLGWFASLLYMLIPPLWIFTGMFARGFLSSSLDPQSIYARVSVELLPAGMLGLVVAALFAPTMAVLSNGYNVIASILTVDVYQRLLRPNSSQKELVVVARNLTALTALGVLGMALGITYFKWQIFNTMVAVFGLFVPPTVLPVLAGLLTPRLSARGALAGYIGGLASGLGLLICNGLISPHNAMTFEGWTIIITVATACLILTVSAAWFPVRGEAAERAAKFFATLRQPPAATETSMTNPTSIAGIVVGVMGITLLIVACGVFVGAGANRITVGTGAIYVLIGGGMALPQWLAARRRRRDSL